MSRIWLLLALLYSLPLAAQAPVRVATFNVGLGRTGPGLLLKDIMDQDPDILAVAEIITHVNPDIVLLTGFDTDFEKEALTRFNALEGLHYPYFFAPLGNAGADSGLDLNANGQLRDWNDAWGFGRFDGNKSMALLSRFPLGSTRVFDALLWHNFGPAPQQSNTDTPIPYWPQRRLAAHSLWDVEIILPTGPLHILAAHPTPPVFDGEEDANGLRNEAEISFLNRYLAGEAFTDDTGRHAPRANAPMVLLADLNADLLRGDSRKQALGALLTHPRLSPMPRHETVDWPSTGRMQVDYVLPDATLRILDSGVYAPEDSPVLEAAQTRHRLVWADIEMPQ